MIPYTSLQVRGRVIEQEREGLRRRSSLLKSLSSRRGSTETTTDNQPHDEVDKRVFKRSTKSFRMSFVLNAGDDGLDQLVNNISSEGHDRKTLFVQATLALWEHRRKAAALRRWKEILQVGSDSFQLSEDLNVNDEARKILYSMEATRIAMENVALGIASPRPGSFNSKCEMSAVSAASKLSRRDLDLLVIWARQMQPKTFPRGVDDTSIREAMKFLRFRQYEDGDALFFEGEIGELFYFLFQGTVAVYVGASTSHLKAVHGTRRNAARRRIDGQKPDLTQLGKRVFAYRTGEGFGETAMFTNDAIRTASAIAVGTCEVCELPKEVYKRTLKKYHQQFFEQAQKINFMQRVPLFKDWQRTRLSSVADLLEKRKLAFGDQLLIEASSVLHCCFFVLSGLVKITKQIDLAPPPFSEDTMNQSTRKKPRHRIHMNIELQTCGSAEIVALEALVEPNSRAMYNAVAASANVELREELPRVCAIVSLPARVRDLSA
uniref:Cyclic nucleotide-binding domain-containing protein n=1 Tax=Globisporangium ultimum (strain ATCC 200006 / CBS 805.95 / DAOM BR144) TaxID=431595 RepID=K3X065_GLOUD